MNLHDVDVIHGGSLYRREKTLDMKYFYTHKSIYKK